MTPNEKNLIKSLVAVAWADGQVKEPETGLIEALLWAFDASDEDTEEIRKWSQTKRTFKTDIPLASLTAEDRTLLLAHAALLTHADGKQTNAEKKILKELTSFLGFSDDQARPIVAGARDRARKLAGKV